MKYRKGLINYNDASTRSTNNGGILMNSQANNDKLATLYSAYDNLAKMSTFDPTISARLVELYNSSRFYSSCEVSLLFLQTLIRILTFQNMYLTLIRFKYILIC